MTYSKKEGKVRMREKTAGLEALQKSGASHHFLVSTAQSGHLSPLCGQAGCTFRCHAQKPLEPTLGRGNPKDCHPGYQEGNLLT